MDDDRWESLEVAARRLDCHKGHLRRLCPVLARAGKARMKRGGGRRSRWQIRRDVTLATTPAAPNELAAPHVTLSVGGVSVTMDGDFSMSVRTSPATGDPQRQANKKTTR